jgi:hypothetical protein
MFQPLGFNCPAHSLQHHFYNHLTFLINLNIPIISLYYLLNDLNDLHRLNYF